MKKSWLLDAFVGLVLSVVFAASYLLPQAFPFIESLELKSYDRRSKLRQAVDVSSEIVLIAIDDSSIAQVGRWPWPRSRVAALLDKLGPAHPKVIGLDVVYSEPEQNQGLIEIQGLQNEYQALARQRKLIDRGKALEPLFESAKVRLDSDSKLLASLKHAPNVVLPMFFADGVIGAKPEPLPAVFSTSTIHVLVTRGGPQVTLLRDVKPVYPIESFAEAAAAIGYVNVEPDMDGVLRRETPVKRYIDSYVPSYPIQLAMSYLGVPPQDALIAPGKELRIGRAVVPLDEDSRMLVTFNGPYQTFRYVSFQDVMNDKVSLDIFKDKIVVIGLTATAVSTLFVTPVAHNFPAPEVVANVIENVLHGRYVTRPPWAQQLELGLLGLVALFIMLALPHLRAAWGFVLSALIGIAIFGFGTYQFVNGFWLKVSYPDLLLLTGYLVVISKRFFFTEKGKELVEASAIETNKMLGLSFQGQGMLDLAFEKFRLCPLDDGMKELLYNLALDFERKRQFSKAAAALEYVAKKDPKYKDLKGKIPMLKQASEGAVFGGVGGAARGGTVVLGGSSTKPTLGRYEIEKELGRGAMGIVYLGRDPKINRQVAIKTMMLEEGSDVAEGKAVRERFFREAESAGTLNHPNIVRIFDAGEEQDIAYIAMELLDGHDFVRYSAKDALLPAAQVLEHVATVADALDYAHQQGIVHRDIKPANLMILKDGTIRVADFGIARITASSKTATGTVMGTPSYMSPEQVAGKKVDGRSDLFSLSVALFELLTGEKPFKGGEGIGTLLFQIANDPYPDPLAIRPDLPPAVVAILDKGLAKNPEDRYPRGSAMAADLRSCAAALKSGGAAQAGATPAVAAPVFEAEPAPRVPVDPDQTIPAFSSAPKGNGSPAGAVPTLLPAGSAEPAAAEPAAAAEPLRTIDIPIEGAVDPSATIRLDKPRGSS